MRGIGKPCIDDTCDHDCDTRRLAAVLPRVVPRVEVRYQTSGPAAINSRLTDFEKVRQSRRWTPWSHRDCRLEDACFEDRRSIADPRTDGRSWIDGAPTRGCPHFRWNTDGESRRAAEWTLGLSFQEYRQFQARLDPARPRQIWSCWGPFLKATWRSTA